MAGCSDERFEKMLYAYELGMLSAEEREAVEMHLLECEHCFERAKQFRDAARLLQVDPAVRDAIRRIDPDDLGTDENSMPDKQAPAPRSQRSAPWAKIALAAAAVLVILILRPWKLEIGPRQEALAAENLLAIMYFDNLADPGDPRRLGDIIANLLMTDLSESGQIQIVSSQRLYDLMKLLGEARPKAISNTMALEVARKAKARWMLTGNILRAEPAYIITSQLIDVASGTVIGTQKITGDSGMTVFALADTLSARIRHELPPGAKTTAAKPERLVAEMTTHSQEAFRYYLEGVDYYYRAYYAEAVNSFEKALELDSTFAMVYYYLSVLKDYSLLARAVEYSDRATEKERYYIEGLQAQRTGDVSRALSIYQQLIDHYPLEKQAYYAMALLKFNHGKYDDAIGHLHNAVALDPLFGNAYNLLSFSYSRLGNLDKALEMNDKFIFLAPNEPNPYDSRGEILAKFKLYDRAIESFKKAIDKKSDFYPSWRNLGNVYTYIGDFLRAESCFQVIASVEDIYVWTDGKIFLFQNLMYQGKFQEALAVQADGSREDKKAHGEEIYATYHHYAALIYVNIGEFSLALEEIAKGQQIAQRAYPQEKIHWRRYYAEIMAESGDMVSARKISEELKTALEEANRKPGDYWYSLGAMEMAGGRLDSAEAYFRKATIDTETFDYSAHYMLGRVLLDRNLPEKAIEQFNILLADQKAHPENWGSWEAEVYYYLGLAYQKSGKRRDAIENFTVYLDIRKNADAQVPSVIDARTRLATLMAGLSS